MSQESALVARELLCTLFLETVRDYRSKPRSLVLWHSSYERLKFGLARSHAGPSPRNYSRYQDAPLSPVNRFRPLPRIGFQRFGR